MTSPRRAADQDDALAEHIRQLVDQAPPLTPAQRDRLAVILRPAVAQVRQQRRGRAA